MNAIGFLSGMFAATFMASGVFFLKFWFASRDRFFIFFAVACWLIGVERIALLMISDGCGPATNTAEADSWVYLIRLLSFILILIAIIEKNRAKTVT